MLDLHEITRKTVPCKWCGASTQMLGTEMCDRCWELEHRIEMDLELAKKMVSSLSEKKLKKQVQKSYLEELRALLNGLECMNIDDLLKESPDIFEALGKEMTLIVKEIIGKQC